MDLGPEHLCLLHKIAAWNSCIKICDNFASSFITLVRLISSLFNFFAFFDDLGPKSSEMQKLVTFSIDTTAYMCVQGVYFFFNTD